MVFPNKRQINFNVLHTHGLQMPTLISPSEPCDSYKQIEVRTWIPTDDLKTSSEAFHLLCMLLTMPHTSHRDEINREASESLDLSDTLTIMLIVAQIWTKSRALLWNYDIVRRAFVSWPICVDEGLSPPTFTTSGFQNHSFKQSNLFTPSCMLFVLAFFATTATSHSPPRCLFGQWRDMKFFGPPQRFLSVAAFSPPFCKWTVLTGYITPVFVAYKLQRGIHGWYSSSGGPSHTSGRDTCDGMKCPVIAKTRMCTFALRGRPHWREDVVPDVQHRRRCCCAWRRGGFHPFKFWLSGRCLRMCVAFHRLPERNRQVFGRNTWRTHAHVRSFDRNPQYSLQTQTNKLLGQHTLVTNEKVQWRRFWLRHFRDCRLGNKKRVCRVNKKASSERWICQWRGIVFELNKHHYRRGSTILRR